MMNSKATSATFTVYLGCCLNNVFLELLVRLDNGIGNLITLSQFLFIAAVGIVTTAKFFTVKPAINMRSYAMLVFFFFVTSVLNNWAFSFNVAVPLHMIFRSGSLIANMILGIIILKREYSLKKYLSVGMITIGIVICTLLSSAKPKICTNCDNDGGIPISDKVVVDDDSFAWWCCGILILTTALLLSARMGIYQEQITVKYGKHPQEALFYTHFLSLPFFAIYGFNILEHFQMAIASESIAIPISLMGLDVHLPIVVLYLIANVLTQYMCISSVYVLTAECSSLTLTLIITLRKFVSLIFSIWYFDNEFTLWHWFGTALVFLGTLLFTDVLKTNFTKQPQKVKTK